MQQLHAPSSEETLIVQGQYNYQLVNRDSGLKEKWSVHHHQANDSLIHRAEIRGVVGQIALKQMIQTEFSMDYRPQRFEMKQTLNENQAETEIQFFETSLHQKVRENKEQAELTLDVPERFGFFYPPVSGQGFLFQHYNFEQGGRQTMPFLSVRIQPVDGPALSVELRHIDHELQGSEEIETPAGQFACRYIKRYEEQMEQQLWIDDSNVVIHWRVPYSVIMTWDYLLTHYQRHG